MPRQQKGSRISPGSIRRRASIPCGVRRTENPRVVPTLIRAHQGKVNRMLLRYKDRKKEQIWQTGMETRPANLSFPPSHGFPFPRPRQAFLSARKNAPQRCTGGYNETKRSLTMVSIDRRAFVRTAGTAIGAAVA